MQYRRLGQSGLKLSELSLGAWVTFGNQLDVRAAVQCMSAARDAGVNFFDNAEVYAGGQAERIMGAALRELGWPRASYVISTKFFWGLTGGSNDPARLELRRPRVLPSRRPGHSARGDGLGDARHHRARQGALLGDFGVECR